MDYWKKISTEEAKARIEAALAENVNFNNGQALGYPVSALDGKIFHDAPFLKDAPLLMAYVSNPNHIGCHTLGSSESAFKGTQAMEREVLEMVACTIFKAEKNRYDGYVAAGGTEANIQALWMYRNIFLKQHHAKLDEIAVVASEDTHYSIAKGANLLMIDWISIPVVFETRAIDTAALENQLKKAIADGKKYFIAVANMGTTMFGSVDDPSVYTDWFCKHRLPFFLHVDAAYGGFVYPILAPDNLLNFDNQHISSIAVDAHKMLQAPYGTGIFLCRKGHIGHVLTKEAQYVEGMDLTLSGSRSGANVIAVWMILKAYGQHGWFEKVKILQLRTDWFCAQLEALGITYFRESHMNIVTLRAKHIPAAIASQYDLVPQQHHGQNHWYKIVVMEHVEVETLSGLLETLVQPTQTATKVSC